MPTAPTPTKVPFRMHPRVFAALGSDLVTNDVVAIIELVKNAYDACAARVDVSFGVDEVEGAYIEVRDDGVGMPRAVIDNVWCVVATPHRLFRRRQRRGKQVRRVSGEKGLGRLSAARLGSRLEIITRAAKEPWWRVVRIWEHELAKRPAAVLRRLRVALARTSSLSC